MIIGLGHPRCGTGFTTSLLIQHGVQVKHEHIGEDGTISWLQVAKRGPSPWGNTLTEYPKDSRIFLVARSPLAALNSVATESKQIRSIGFRSQVIWERRGIDIFAWNQQTSPQGQYDYFGWAVMSLAWWYDICLEERPEFVYRVDHPQDDQLLSNLVGRPISREDKNIWRNEKPHVKKDHYDLSELGRVPKVHLQRLIAITRILGYPDDAEIMKQYL